MQIHKVLFFSPFLLFFIYYVSLSFGFRYSCTKILSIEFGILLAYLYL